ncbi:uncharacterized protein C8Q71DRAFT_33064 [Rhodofomes roseus]|uniref:RRM domain-containing protein n=1 Tax=Rhodofomes roseus TaxID=34475 RepID=A0ABQ8KXZ5_9APHY|nr:uncharacterized protein C8Q71DRAFT_33064 [Rhodofomes roseus]KAH9844167.1 hypothetical protein C8Q71DRAFT_33064 [Rhodofomes roseus]
MSSASSSSSSASSSDSEGKPPQKTPHLADDDSEDDSGDSDSESSSSDDEPAPGADEDDGPVLSHKEQRKQKRKELKALSAATLSAKQQGKQPVKNSAELAPSKLPRRQNSVWVGNMTFKTTPDALRRFFEGVGEITRVHMPMKMASGGPGAGGARKENRGFAYVDFATPDAKTIAITRSENPLDGRRLLIKDGDDFNGRPAATADAGDASGTPAPNLSGHTKTAQKILRAQKQPAGPTLFLGNLGFETTDQSIRQLFDSHRPKPAATTDHDADADADAEDADAHKKEADKKEKPWIRKVRMGTFEDSGKCKGWAFVDFTSPEHATSALVNPKNHFLDGRKLVVEYASPDAVRRGGNIPRSKDIKDKRAATGRERQPKTDRAPYHQKDEASSPHRKRKDRGEDADVAAEPAAADGEDASPKRRRVEDGARVPAERGTAGKGGKPPRARPKPGAALALAKRETAAIVPSQGRKIVF